jgi:hypothetical protein
MFMTLLIDSGLIIRDVLTLLFSYAKIFGENVSYCCPIAIDICKHAQTVDLVGFSRAQSNNQISSKL